MADQNENASPRRKWRRWALAAGFVALLIGLVIGFRAHTKRAFERKVQGIRERGYPTSPQEVHTWYAAVPPEENAALGISKAYDFYVEAGKNDPQLLGDGLVLGEPLPPKLAGAIASMVER